jgi:hypothetical protein
MLIVLFIVTTSVPQTRGIPRPSFDDVICAWEATDIVVGSKGEKIDGVVKVLESWKGDLKTGDLLTVPELAEFADEKARIIAKPLGTKDTSADEPESVTCSRMVLFLVRKQNKANGGKPESITWLPANTRWKKIHVSIAWIEKGKVVAFRQCISPGPSELILHQTTEAEFKRQVENVLALQAKLRHAIQQEDSAKLAATVKPLLGVEV